MAVKPSEHHNEIVKTHQPTPIILTDSAAKKVATLIHEEGNMSLKLRAFITGGGCSGFQYGFTFDEKRVDDDTVVEKFVEVAFSDQPMMVCLLVDPMSFQYLAGATIDYLEDLEGSRFVIKNPNAKTTCGCGQSFAA